MANPVKVIKGEDISIPLKIREGSTNDPYNLTGKTVSGVVVTDSGTTAVSSGSFTITDATLGKVTMVLSDTITSQMKKGLNSFEVVLVDGTDTKIVQFMNQLDVRERL